MTKKRRTPAGTPKRRKRSNLLDALERVDTHKILPLRDKPISYKVPGRDLGNKPNIVKVNNPKLGDNINSAQIGQISSTKWPVEAKEQNKMGIQYTVTRDGMVVNMHTVDEVPYEVRIRTTTELPWKHRQITRFSRWMPLKKAVVAQEPGVWYIYAGFGDAHELKQARSAFAKYKTDAMLRNRLNGHELKLSTNGESLELAVMKEAEVRVNINELDTTASPVEAGQTQ